MTVVALAPTPPELAAPDGRIVSVARVRGMGIFLLLLALIMVGPFGLAVPAHLKATFLLSAPPALGVAPLVMPVRVLNVALAIVCVGLACTLLGRRTRARRLPVVRARRGGLHLGPADLGRTRRGAELRRAAG